MTKWQPIEWAPIFEDRPIRQLIVVEGQKHHSGASWFRRYVADAYISRNDPFGYRREDLDRAQRDGDMDYIEKITFWMPFILPEQPK